MYFCNNLCVYFHNNLSISATGVDCVGSVATAEMLFRSNLIALVGGGNTPKFDEKAGEIFIYLFIYLFITFNLF